MKFKWKYGLNSKEMNQENITNFESGLSVPGTEFDIDGFAANQTGNIDIGDGCWSQNVLVTRLRCWCQVTIIKSSAPTSRVRHQHQIAVTSITFWCFMMLLTDVSNSEFVYTWIVNSLYWIWHQDKFFVSNIAYRSTTSHYGALWC